ncbi:IS4/Tn5 family transposase DNA-binding protein [Paraburkholderia sp. JPY419]|uniref:IS4/Tn5 family transposase DNA-binding protein n=1 Tax=Paraburkholderia sp. JPY419 TaxID=667660 RepID=UPI003D22B294
MPGGLITPIIPGSITPIRDTSEEFGAAERGDARLTKRLVMLARRLSTSPHCSFPQSFNASCQRRLNSDPRWVSFTSALTASELKAAYRFFDNPGGCRWRAGRAHRPNALSHAAGADRTCGSGHH